MVARVKRNLMRKMGIGEAIFFALLIYFMLLSAVSASFISMTTNIDDVQIQNGSGQGHFSVSNKGDESAYDVSISFMLPTGFYADDVYVGKLDSGRLIEDTISIAVEGELPQGVQPGALMVNYRDANSYPFSAVTPFTIVVGKRTTANIIGVFEELTLAGTESRRLKLHIKNTDKEQHDLSVNLYLPRELNARSTFKQIQLPGSEETEIDFTVSSFSALPGSTYAVFTSISYIKNKESYTTFTRGIIKIEKEKSIFSNQTLTIALLVLLAAFLFYQLRGKST